MVQMIKSKREWVCSSCSAKYIKFWGSCKNCKKAGTLKEVQLIEPKPKATLSQKSLMRRSKNSERTIARRMLDADGQDPNFAKIASSTGRIGHITNIRVDAVSKQYFTENKNRVMPKWVIDAWILINQKATDSSKYALLHMEPPNMPKDFLLNGERHKLDTMAIIRQDRHEQLIAEEHLVQMAREIMASPIDNEEMLYKIRALFGSL